MGDAQRNRLQFTLRTLLLVVAVCALPLSAYFTYRQQVGSDIDSYTGVQLAAMVNAYLDAHADAWPRDWEELRKYHAFKITRDEEELTFDDIRDSWTIDFQADPVALAQAPRPDDGPPFEVFRQRHDRPMTIPLYEPNVRVWGRLRDHAGLQTAAMVIAYMKANQNAWPKGWGDLQACYQAAVKMYGSHWCSFAQARAAMVVDFTADPIKLAEARPAPDERPFNVVRPRHGTLLDGEWEPNRVIFEYLRGEH